MDLGDLLRMVVLGIVQGLTEFFPISSSGHLIITRDLFGWEFSDNLTFDVALHLGTTAAVVAFFWREWWSMAQSGLRWAASGGRDTGPAPYNAHLLFLLALGSVPAAVIGGVFEGPIEDRVRSPLVVGAMLIVFAGVLWAADRIGSRRRRMEDGRWFDAVWIGVAQAVSLVPGVSRSGVTITAALQRNFTREDAARLSFLLSTPVIIGAGLLKMTEAARDGVSRGDYGLMAVGALAAAVSGWLAIHFLLRWVRAGTYAPFVFYRLAAGVFILFYFGLT